MMFRESLVGTSVSSRMHDRVSEYVYSGRRNWRAARG